MALDNVMTVKSAYTAAQTEVDRKLEYSNPYAMPIAFRAIDTAAEQLGDAATVAAIVDAAFHGRLRGTVLKVLRQHHAL